MSGDRHVHAKAPARRTAGERPARDLGLSFTCSSPAGAGAMPGRLRPAHDGLQPHQQVVAPGLMARHAGRARRGGLGGRGSDVPRVEGGLPKLKTRAPLVKLSYQACDAYGVNRRGRLSLGQRTGGSRPSDVRRYSMNGLQRSRPTC